jgi:hypothetical protein
MSRSPEDRILRDLDAMTRLQAERASARERLSLQVGPALADRLLFALAADHRPPRHSRRDAA